MITSTVSFARPLVVKQAFVQAKKHRSVIMAVSEKHDQVSSPDVDRRRVIPMMLLPALLLAAKPAAAIGRDPRKLAKEREARKAKMREELKAKTTAVGAKAPAAAE